MRWAYTGPCRLMVSFSQLLIVGLFINMLNISLWAHASIWTCYQDWAHIVFPYAFGYITHGFYQSLRHCMRHGLQDRPQCISSLLMCINIRKSNAFDHVTRGHHTSATSFTSLNPINSSAPTPKSHSILTQALLQTSQVRAISTAVISTPYAMYATPLKLEPRLGPHRYRRRIL